MKKIIISVLTSIFIFSCSWFTPDNTNPNDPDYQGTSNKYVIDIIYPNGNVGSESLTAAPETAAPGTQITLTVSNLGTERQVSLSAPGISISPEVITSSGGTATFTMPAGDVTITAKFSYNAGYSVEHTAGSVNFDMNYVLSGTFEMGHTNVSIPVHTVTLTKDFWMGETEVTQGLWEAMWGTDWPGKDEYISGSSGPRKVPSSTYGLGTDYPAYFVTWYDVVAFCNLLTIADDSIADNQQVYYSDSALTITYTKANAAAGEPVHVDWDKKGYRLPTEAEWEYAARYINGTDWNGGDHVSGDTSAPYNTSTVIGDYAWYKENSGDNGGSTNRKSHEVGQKLPNALGLRDMSGNVWEWCHDWYDNYSDGSVTDPRGPESGPGRVDRGGSWNSVSDLRCVCRGYLGPLARYGFLGFRLCRTAD